jgi:HTH-type transcriptional regulator / antitoxin HigA
MTEEQMSYEYDVPAPGYFIQEELDARGWSQRDLAFILGTEETALNKIIKGKTGISVEMSKALGTAFDVDPDFFANLQKSYELAHGAAPDPAIARRARLQSRYPVREMIKRGWLQNSEPSLLEMQMARFFRTNSPGDVAEFRYAAKKTNYGEEASPSQLAWLYRVMQIGEAIASKDYSERALKQAIPQLRRLMAEPQEARHVPRILMDCGVRFVIVEGLPNAKIDGVCLWLNAKTPVIGLSLRYDRNDNFWFVLWHEIAHVLHRHGQSEPIIDVELERNEQAKDETIRSQEAAANMDAEEYCIPQHEIMTFIARKTPFFAERDIVGFAHRMQVHPGIVVGQIQKRTERWELLRKYLVKVRQFLLPGAMVDGWGQVAPVTI